MTVAAAERFWSKVQVAPGLWECWLWQGSLFPGGYGQFWYDGTNRLAHRVAYELTIGPIEESLELDHLCRVRACVRPTHLEPVTPRVNTLRGSGITAINASKSTCSRGHALSPTSRSYGSPRRFCRGHAVAA